MKIADCKSWQDSGFRYNCNTAKVLAIKKGSAVLVALLTIVFVLAGTYSCQSIGDIAVLLSWALLFLPVVFSWAALLVILRTGDTVTWKQYKKGPERLRQSGAFGALISAVSVFCCCYFIATGDIESVAVEIGMLGRILAEFFLAVGVLLIGRYHISQMEESGSRINPK